MNFKKSYKSANGYTKISKIGESSLKKLEFGIIELKAGDSLDFYTEDKETAFIISFSKEYLNSNLSILARVSSKSSFLVIWSNDETAIICPLLMSAIEKAGVSHIFSQKASIIICK